MMEGVELKRLKIQLARLLAACEHAVAWIGDVMVDPDELSEDAQGVLATLEAAIAEAKGVPARDELNTGPFADLPPLDR